MKKKFVAESFPCYAKWIALAAAGWIFLIPQQAIADAGDTVNVTVGSTFTYDSNIFRLSSIIDPERFVGKPTRADQVIVSTATLSINKNYSMQRFEFNGSIVDNRYNNFDFLNFVGKNYTAAWNWFITPYFHGRMSSSHRESLNNFANLTGFVNSTNKNLRTDDNLKFDAVYEIDGVWRLIGGFAQDTRKNGKLNVQDFNNRVRSIEGGIRYAFPSGASFTYKVRSGAGDFFDRAAPIESSLFDTRFNEMEHDLHVIWPITGKTSIDARVGHLERKHAHFHQRDFSGIVGNFNLNWAVTGKTRITASWSRELFNSQTSRNFQLSGFELFSSSYAINNRFTFAPIWQISEKTALRLRYDYTMRDFHGAVVVLPNQDRSDSIHSGLIAFDWRPMNMLWLSATLQRDHRSSTHRGFDYDNAAASISARLNF
jgi:exopolysaccharide biosynthesis operon protein EpsL